MIRLQDPMAFEAYVCLSPAVYISVSVSGMATVIGLDSSPYANMWEPPQGMISQSDDRRADRGTSVACDSYAELATICGQRCIKERGSNMLGFSNAYCTQVKREKNTYYFYFLNALFTCVWLKLMPYIWTVCVILSFYACRQQWLTKWIWLKLEYVMLSCVQILKHLVM